MHEMRLQQNRVIYDQPLNMYRPNLQASPASVNMPPANWQRGLRPGQSPAGLQMRPPGMVANTPHTPDGNKRAADVKGPRAAKSVKKKRLKDRIIIQEVIDLVPESQAYMDLLAFENKLDSTITRKKLDIQEALKRPLKQKRTLRIFIATNFYQPKTDESGRETSAAEWEVRVEGRLLQESEMKDNNPKQKRKFSSFFKNLVIELDKNIYGPDNHLVEWHRTSTTQETDGFQDFHGGANIKGKLTEIVELVKRQVVGNGEVKCQIFLMIDYKPPQCKLAGPLSRILGIHTSTRPVIINALWQYIKKNKLQDSDEREFINNDVYMRKIFGCPRMKFCEIPQRLQVHLLPPDPIIITYYVNPANTEAKRAQCYDIEIEMDESLREMMQSFLLSSASQQEIAALDAKIHETVEGINQLKVHRDFFLSFSTNPQKFMNDWLTSQCNDLKTLSDTSGNAEEERLSEFYNQPWVEEAVHRYFYRQIQSKRIELEQALGIRSST